MSIALMWSPVAISSAHLLLLCGLIHILQASPISKPHQCAKDARISTHLMPCEQGDGQSVKTMLTPWRDHDLKIHFIRADIVVCDGSQCMTFKLPARF
jgi:hypothetical protein